MQPNALLIQQNFIITKSGCYSITAPDSSSCPDEGNIIRIVIRALHLGLNGVIYLAHPRMESIHTFATSGALPAWHTIIKTMILSTQPTICS
jgi:hypothetical protein